MLILPYYPCLIDISLIGAFHSKETGGCRRTARPLRRANCNRFVGGIHQLIRHGRTFIDSANEGSPRNDIRGLRKVLGLPAYNIGNRVLSTR